MALRNIVVEGDEILRKKCREVSEITDRIKLTLEDMLETMREEMGVGIAAPQVGVMRRMFIAEPEPGRVYYMINPEILEKSGSQIDDEGCLSVPGMIGTVERPQYIKIRTANGSARRSAATTSATSTPAIPKRLLKWRSVMLASPTSRTASTAKCSSQPCWHCRHCRA